jgi:glycosyltransferase involved in cell wall biosynthesis
MSETKIVFDCIDWYEEMYQKEFPNDATGLSLLRGGLDRALKFSHKVICQSPITKEYVSTMMDGVAEKAISIPNGYDKNIFSPGDGIRQQLIYDYPEIKGKKLIVFAGKLGKWYERILEVCDVVSRSKEWIFLIVGDGPLAEKVQKYENVCFVGRVPLDKVPLYTRSADVCVLPVDDDCPLATMEYFAVGAPVIHYGTRIRWILQDKENGKMVLHRSEWIPSMNYCAENKARIRKNNILKIRGYTWTALAGKMKLVMEGISNDSNFKDPTELGAKISS